MQKIKSDYNSISEDFSSKRQKIWEEFVFLFEDLKEGEKVLDLGCGNGRWFEIFKDKKVDYTGVDFSEKLIEIAKRRFPEGKFLVADALNLPFSENFFDKVYSLSVLHHIPSKELRLQFFKEIKRVLKPRGKAIITVWKIHQLRERLLLLRETILKLIGKSKLDFKDFFVPWGQKIVRYYHCFSENELTKLAEKVSLKVVKRGEIKNQRKNRQNLYLICEKLDTISKTR